MPRSKASTNLETDPRYRVRPKEPMIAEHQRAGNKNIGGGYDLTDRSRPDTSNHVSVKWDSSNKDHRHILDTLLNNGIADDLVVHEGGIVSFPKNITVEKGGREILQKRLQNNAVMAETTPSRPSNKTSAPAKRPAAPVDKKARTIPPARLPRPSGQAAPKKPSNIDLAYKAEQESKKGNTKKSE